MAWPMYSEYAPAVPPAVASELRVRATDLIERDYGSVLDKVFDAAFDLRRDPPDADPAEGVDANPADDDPVPAEAARRTITPEEMIENRAYLLRLVRRALPGVRPRWVELIKAEWRTDPYALPPLDVTAPSGRTVLGRFRATRPYSIHPVAE